MVRRMIAEIDARARGQVAEQFAARFAYLAQRLGELGDLRTTTYPITLADLATTMGLDGAPTAVRVKRWTDSFPQYLPGHLQRVAQIEHTLAADAPGVLVAGAAQRGVGIPACIRQGREAAAALIEHLSRQ